MWNNFGEALGAVLAFFYGVIPNYGAAIILLTVSVRLALYPLTAKQARAQAKMQRIQPELKKLQAKHKGNKQKLNEETMKLYRENRVNPLGGCLPLVLQMPIFIALYRVLRAPHLRVPGRSALYHAFCGAQAVKTCSPKGLGFLGMDLAKSLRGTWENLIAAVPYAILVAGVVLVGVIQGRQSKGASPGGQANSQAKLMARLFPVMFGFISLSMPAGIVLYFLVSSGWQVGQQQVVSRKLGVAKPMFGSSSDAGAASPIEGARTLLGRLSPGGGKEPAATNPAGARNDDSGPPYAKKASRPELTKPGDADARPPAAPARSGQGTTAKPRGKKRRT